MSSERRAPMVNLGCRVPRSLVERIAALVTSTGLDRCDVIRQALDLGASALERESANHGGQQG